MNQFLIEKIYQKLITFQISIKKRKFKSFCDIVERMDVARWEKNYPPPPPPRLKPEPKVVET